MIIDAHTHIHPEKDAYGPEFDATPERLLNDLAESEVDKAVVLPLAADSPYAKRTENCFVAEWCAKAPDKLIGFASVHPLEHGDAARRLEHAVTGYGLKGLKLHPRFQGIAADDPRIVPVVEKAAELGVPVAIDCLLWKPTPLRDQLPLNIDALCKRVPAATIIMCHAGGFRFLDALAVAVANDNVYLDVSVSLTYFHGTPFEDQFMFALKQVGAKRLIYGSDHPQHPLHECYIASKAIFETHGFSKEELGCIFSGTFLSLVGG
ncbi:MAG TPA: amidohydrolase [Candidatus Hydrogenedentes bacterium]|nr:amidohydrolase [Candidatus Hydrogenedentota bacterium]HIJ74463.1 amidohydrolase [Candidatus Hydrogenedentota bacterium]